MGHSVFLRKFLAACLGLGLGLGLATAVSAAERLPFSAYAPPPMPDYARSENWAARPDLQDAADSVLDGDRFGDRQSRAAVDVFYIHPTTYRGDAWNQDVADQATNRWTDSSVMAHQAGAFNACCRVYAPRYRQAASGAVFARDDSGERAYDLAYQDVRRAFDYYLSHYNKGRPFMLAGHSQGSRHLVQLLAEIAGDHALMGRMVAAYAIGYGVSVGEGDRALAPIKACGTPTQTGCLLSWNSFLADGDAAAYLARSEARFTRRYGVQEGKTLICVNPLTFDAARPQGLGAQALGAQASGGSHTQVASAACKNGILYVEPGEARTLSLLPALSPLSGGNLHMNDISLFYDNLRADAVTRAKAWKPAAVDAF